MKIHEASKILILGQIVGFTVKRGAVVTSRCHGSNISGSQQTVLLQIWQKTQKNLKKNDIYDFLVQYCTQEQNCSRYFSSIVQQCKWPSISRSNAEIQKFCCHGNVTSHYSPLHSLKTWITRKQNMQVSR